MLSLVPYLLVAFCYLPFQVPKPDSDYSPTFIKGTPQEDGSQKSGIESQGRLEFPIPEDILAPAFEKYGRPKFFTMRLLFNSPTANPDVAAIGLIGSYATFSLHGRGLKEKPKFELDIENRQISTGSSSSMITGELVFGSDKKLRRRFVISIAKSGEGINEEDPLEGHILWLPATDPEVKPESPTVNEK